MTGLQRTEAAERARLIDVADTDVVLDLTGADTGARTFRSTTRLRFTVREPGRTFVDLRPDALEDATLDGPSEIAEFDADAGRLWIDAAPGEQTLSVRAAMRYSVDGEGLHRHVDPADGRTYLYAMSFLDAAPRWFACFDQPDLKTPFTLGVRAPSDWTVAGNGPAVSEGGGSWSLSQPRRLSTYVTTLVAGPYAAVRGVHDGIPLTLLARASLSAELQRDGAELLTHTGQCFDAFHRMFGVRYPWGEYCQAFVPEFNAGAMENPGCVTFADRVLFRSQATAAERLDRANTVAHEMAHMWFGDLVTMQWWDDLWLNESFAEYLGHRVCDQIGLAGSWAQFGIERKAWGYAADRRPSTHPVAGNGAADTSTALADFDGISYAKGAAVLKQLAARLGDEIFLRGLRDYIARYSFGNASFADLMAAWERAGAVDLDEWTAGWLRTAGADSLAVRSGALVRRPPAGSPAAREHAVTVASYGPDGGELGRARVILRDETPMQVPAGALTLPDVADETWARIDLAPEDWAAAEGALPRLDPVARVVVWNALRAGVAEATVDPRFAVRLVSQCSEQESDAVLGQLYRWAIGPVVGAYLCPEDRSAALQDLHEAALCAADAPSSDAGRHLAGVRAAIDASPDVDRLREFQSEGHVEGVPLDADLRWRIWLRLAALGGCDRAEIDAAEHEDETAEGVENAARCRAALPDPDAKQAAWTLLTTPGAASSAVLYETARGFWQPTQLELTSEYAARWFDDLPATARFRSGSALARVAWLSFPWVAVDAETVARAEAVAGRDDVAPGVRRAAMDGGDDVRRALASRARFCR